jgi:hypothetical protein
MTGINAAMGLWTFDPLNNFEIGHSRFTYEQKQRVYASGGRSDALRQLNAYRM